jgi:hypothetical protein
MVALFERQTMVALFESKTTVRKWMIQVVAGGARCDGFCQLYSNLKTRRRDDLPAFAVSR